MSVCPLASREVSSSLHVLTDHVQHSVSSETLSARCLFLIYFLPYQVRILLLSLEFYNLGSHNLGFQVSADGFPLFADLRFDKSTVAVLGILFPPDIGQYFDQEPCGDESS